MEGNPICSGRGRPRKTIDETSKKDLNFNSLFIDMVYDRTQWCYSTQLTLSSVKRLISCCCFVNINNTVHNMFVWFIEEFYVHTSLKLLIFVLYSWLWTKIWDISQVYLDNCHSYLLLEIVECLKLWLILKVKFPRYSKI